MQTPCPDLNWTLWCHLQFLTSWKTEQAISHLKANARRRESRLKHCFEINACSMPGIARTYFSKDWIAFISSSWWSPPQKPIAPCMADSKLVARLASRTRPSSILSTFWVMLQLQYWHCYSIIPRSTSIALRMDSRIWAAPLIGGTPKISPTCDASSRTAELDLNTSLRPSRDCFGERFIYKSLSIEMKTLEWKGGAQRSQRVG